MKKAVFIAVLSLVSAGVAVRAHEAAAYEGGELVFTHNMGTAASEP